MQFLKKCLQVVFSPIAVGIATVGLGLFAVCGVGPWKVIKHVSRNIVLLTPRIPSLIKEMWTDTHKESVREDNPPHRLSRYGHWAVLIIGLPFIVTMILLDDFE